MHFLLSEKPLLLFSWSPSLPPFSRSPSQYRSHTLLFLTAKLDKEICRNDDDEIEEIRSAVIECDLVADLFSRCSDVEGYLRCCKSLDARADGLYALVEALGARYDGC